MYGTTGIRWMTALTALIVVVTARVFASKSSIQSLVIHPIIYKGESCYYENDDQDCPEQKTFGSYRQLRKRLVQMLELRL